MGLNRQMRRQQERQAMRNWRKSSDHDRISALQRNGITVQELDKSYEDGYREGYGYASEAFMKLMYAAIAQELDEAGNDRDEIVSFLHGVDHRFAVMYDADDEIQDVYDRIGIRLNIDRNAIDRIEEV